MMTHSGILKKMVELGISIILLAACETSPVEEINPSETPAPTQITIASTETVAQYVQTSISSTTYLDECKVINSLKFTEQVSYQNILPGITREADLMTLLGSPSKVNETGTTKNWIYDNFGVFLEKGTVTDILVSFEQNINNTLTLRQIVLKYGCPDIILAVNTTEDQKGYTSVFFIYPEIGLDISFSSYPASFTAVPSTMGYFKPTDVQGYMRKNGWHIMGIQSGKPVEWNDAVK